MIRGRFLGILECDNFSDVKTLEVYTVFVLIILAVGEVGSGGPKHPQLAGGFGGPQAPE